MHMKCFAVKENPLVVRHMLVCLLQAIINSLQASVLKSNYFVPTVPWDSTWSIYSKTRSA